MTTEHNIQTEGAPEPVGSYPHAKIVGDLLFVSGMGPRKRGSKTIPGVKLNSEGDIVAYDIDIQTRSVLHNICEVLKGAGCEIKDIIDIQVFLTNMKDDFKTFNKVYGEYFDHNGPTRTTVEVLSLPTPIAVELKVIAKLKN